jgi:regulator of nucleoside diphosphate kinase
MFTQKTTITRPDRDRLVEVTRAKGNALSFAMLIDDLRRGLRDARVVESSHIARDVVTMHSTVHFLDLRTKQREIFTLVYPHEADLNVGKLSVLTPLGTALLGAKVGDTISVQGSAGTRSLEIESVLDQPEARGDVQSARFASEVVS